MSGHIVRDFSHFRNMPLSEFIYMFNLHKEAHKPPAKQASPKTKIKKN